MTLSGGRRARLEYAIYGSVDDYSILTIKILNTNQGAIDAAWLEFGDFFAQQDNGCGYLLQPHIRVGRGEISWTRNPAPEEMKALADTAREYIALFA
ncbi:MAG: hypothetical protein AB9880_09210 [Christensenellales bacterium]